MKVILELFYLIQKYILQKLWVPPVPFQNKAALRDKSQDFYFYTVLLSTVPSHYLFYFYIDNLSLTLRNATEMKLSVYLV